MNYIKRFIFGKKQMDTRQTKEKKKRKITPHKLVLGSLQSICIKIVKKSGAGQLGSKKNSLFLRKHTVLPKKIPTFMQ